MLLVRFTVLLAVACQVSLPSTQRDDHEWKRRPFVGLTIEPSLDPWPGQDERSELEAAIDLGKPEKINALLGRGTLVTLHAAARLGMAEEVDAICQREPKRIDTTVNGLTALGDACISGQLRVVKNLLARGADIDAGFGNRRPICMAAQNGHPEILRVLLEHHAQLPTSGAAARDVLMMAACSKSVECVRLLINNMTAFPTKEVVASEVMPLAADKPEVLTLLLPHAQSASLGLALFHATRLHSLEAMNLLLASGAPTNWGDNFGETPLNMAVDQDDLAAVNLLLDHGADPRYRVNGGNAPLDRAESENHKAAELLLKSAREKTTTQS